MQIMFTKPPISIVTSKQGQVMLFFYHQGQVKLFNAFFDVRLKVMQKNWILICVKNDKFI